MDNIHKVQAVADFTILHNRVAREKRLSFRARGVLIMMLTLPPDWQSHATWIEEQGTEGREALRAAFKELERFGYLKRTKIREANKFSGMQWEWRHTPPDGFPSDGLPSDDKPATTKNRSDEELRDKEKKKGGFVPKRTGVFKPRYPYPENEEALESLLTKCGVDYDPDHDGGFFEEMNKRAWSTPDGRPVYDVAKIYEARMQNNSQTSKPSSDSNWSRTKSNLPRFVL